MGRGGEARRHAAAQRARRWLLALPGRGHAFVHGEAQAVLLVRRDLIRERGSSTDQLPATGYWKLRCTDEQWREEKRAWIAEAERDLAA